MLDLGCGPGHVARILAERGYAVTGVEQVKAAGFPERVRLVEADLDAGLPDLGGERFDVILCADILEHLKRPEDLLGQLPGLLAPGGKLIASLPNSGNLYFRLNILAGRFPRHEKGLFDRTHLHFYMWDGWVELLAACGFRIEEVVSSGIPVGLQFPGFAEAAWVRVCERLCYDSARVWKRLFAYQFIVTARPKQGSSER